MRTGFMTETRIKLWHMKEMKIGIMIIMRLRDESIFSFSIKIQPNWEAKSQKRKRKYRTFYYR